MCDVLKKTNHSDAFRVTQDIWVCLTRNWTISTHTPYHNTRIYGKQQKAKYTLFKPVYLYISNGNFEILVKIVESWIWIIRLSGVKEFWIIIFLELLQQSALSCPVSISYLENEWNILICIRFVTDWVITLYRHIVAHIWREKWLLGLIIDKNDLIKWGFLQCAFTLCSWQKYTLISWPFKEISGSQWKRISSKSGIIPVLICIFCLLPLQFFAWIISLLSYKDSVQLSNWLQRVCVLKVIHAAHFYWWVIYGIQKNTILFSKWYPNAVINIMHNLCFFLTA